MNWNCLFCLTIKGVFILFVLWKSWITTLSKNKCWKAAGSDPQSKQRKDMEWQQRGLKSFMLLVFCCHSQKTNKQKKSLTWKFLCTDKETHTYLNHERCDIRNRRDTLSSKKSHHKHAFQAIKDSWVLHMHATLAHIHTCTYPYTHTSKAESAACVWSGTYWV